MENFIFCAVKDTIIKLIIENSKYNNENEYFQNKNNNDSTQTRIFVTPKKPAKLTTDIKILTTLHPSTVLKYYMIKK